MLSGKTLVCLNVGDSARSTAFYEALLGAAPSRQDAGATVFDLESPPLVLTLEAIDPATAPSRRTWHAGELPRAKSGKSPHAGFTLVVNEPRHVGDAAIALRRAGVPIRIEDHGIAACDPDENAWQVRFEPSAPGRAVLETPPRDRRSA